MSGTELLSTTAASMSAGILAYSGARHALHLPQFRRALREHEIVPGRAHLALAIGVIVVETILGTAGVMGVFGWTTAGALSTTFGVMAALYVLYAVYATVAMVRRPTAPCGCSTLDAPLNGWVVGRALVLAGLSAATALAREAIVTPVQPGGEIVMAAAVAFGVLVWSLPVVVSDDLPAPDGLGLGTPA